MSQLKCRICGNESDNQLVTLCGTMYGTKGEFEYFICKNCGCLQIKSEVDDIGKYYSSDQYYSFNMNKRQLKNELLFLQMKHQLGKKNILGAMVGSLYPVKYDYFSLVEKEDAILDVGCGDGELLRWLKRTGYKDVLGIDPFLENDVVLDDKLFAVKGEVQTYAFDRSFKMITLIHSLEHVFPQYEHIKALDKILSVGGYMVFQLPVFSKYYWEKYGRNLYTLDPPRHFYLHTEKSLQELMKPFGYELVDFSTEIDVAIPELAKNIQKGQTEKNSGTSLVSGTINALKSGNLRKKLKAENDGAIATVIFKKVE